MPNLSIMDFPKLSPWDRFFPYDLTAPDKDDKLFHEKNDLYCFFMRYYEILSKDPQKMNIPTGIKASQIMIDKTRIKIKDKYRQFVSETQTCMLEAGEPEIFRLQNDIISSTIQFLYDLALKLELRDDEVFISHEVFITIKNNHEKLIIKNKKELEKNNVKIKTVGLRDMLYFELGFDADEQGTEFKITNVMFPLMPLGLYHLAQACAREKKLPFYKFCLMNFSERPMDIIDDQVYQCFPDSIRYRVKNIMGLAKTKKNCSVKVEYKTQLGRIVFSRLSLKIKGNPVYVVYHTNGNQCLYNTGHYLRWILDVGLSEKYFNTYDKENKELADLVYTNLRRCNLSKCSSDNGSWCKLNYRAELIRADEHFFICGVETWNNLSLLEWDFNVIEEYIQSILRSI